MGTTFRLLDLSDPEWGALVARTPHDVYHLRGYARLSETHEPFPPRLAVVDDGRDVLVLPVILRPLPSGMSGGEGLCDVTVPYGYPVPVSSSDDTRTVRALAQTMWDGLRATGAVTAFLRWHPFLGVPRASLAPEARFAVHGEHVVIPLDDLGEDPVRTFREGHRTDVRALIRNGYTTRDDDAGDWAAFPSMYRETMERAGAEPYYLFPDVYFASMRSELGGHARLASVVAPDGHLAASAILFVCGSVAQYHLSCAQAGYLANAPTKLAVVRMIVLARELGATRLNLGSGLGGARDSLFSFKAGFSRQRAPFESVRVVLDAKRYEALSSGATAPDDFFPAYRYDRAKSAGRMQS